MNERHATFRNIFLNHGFGGDESVSGPGSSLAATETVRRDVQEVLHLLHVRTMLDIPCGDLHWMREISVPPYCEYTGADLVPEIVQLAAERARGSKLERSAKRVAFEVIDLCESPIERFDLVLVRDCLGHLPIADVLLSLDNLRRSRSRYLLTTHFPCRGEQPDIAIGGWRPIDLCAPPFYLPEPSRIMVENCIENGEMFNDKSLALFKLGE